MKHIWYWKIEETKSCERYLILKFLREAIKTISLSNFLSQPSQAGKIFNCSIQNVIWNSNIRDTKGFSMKKNNKNDVIEISKNMEMSLHQRYQFLSYSCFDCLLSTKIRLPRLHSAHNQLKVWTMKNCANKQGDKFWCPKQNSRAKFTDQNTFRVLDYSYGRYNPFGALYFWILQSRRGAI